MSKYVQGCLRDYRAQERQARVEKEFKERELASKLEWEERMRNKEKAEEFAQFEKIEQEKLAQHERIEREKLAVLERVEQEKLEIAKQELAIKEREVDLRRENGRDKRAALQPKIPYFDDKSDDIESYLRRFESQAKARNWTRDEWGSNLVSLLRGKALTYVYELPPEVCLSYDHLVKHLMKRF